MWLIATDTHFSDRPKDEYRFGLLKWMSKLQEKHNVDATFLLGDLTQDKDNHSSTLVNRTIEELVKLRPPVYILRGNHDGIDHNNPFFKFLNCVDGFNFIVEPELISFMVPHQEIAMVPHCRTQELFDAACAKMPKGVDTLMLHQTVAGAIAETGRPLTGLKASPIELLKPALCYSGDVHKPQRCGPVTYVGAPYPIRFGDDFEGRVMLVDGQKEQSLHYPCIHKWTLRIRDAEELLNNPKLKAGDQVKLIIELSREEMLDWSSQKRKALAVCKELKLEVFGVDVDVKTSTRKTEKKESDHQGKTKTEVLEEFCKAEKLSSQIKQTGKELLEG